MNSQGAPGNLLLISMFSRCSCLVEVMKCPKHLHCKISLTDFYFIHFWESGQIVLMLDGTFGCVRKESSGVSIEPPKHGDRFFLKQGLVDDFVAKHGKDSKGLRLVNNSSCALFHTGL